MARFPGAIWRPIDSRFLPGKRMAVFNRMNLHVAVSEGRSLHGYFNAQGRASCHFYVRKDGSVEQYVDTDWQAEADLEGNDATLSVETQGGVHNANGEPWTPEQVETLAALFAWAVETHGIARKVATSSRLGDESKGLSWHRLGVPATKAQANARRSQTGGMLYSRAVGKICPGDAKIGQVPEIFNRAMAILGGATITPVSHPVPPAAVTTPAAPPRPVPPQISVDGKWGSETTTALQRVLGTPQDGVISGQYRTDTTRALYGGVLFPKHPKGSTMVAALQRFLGVKDDGLLGPATVRALQRRLGTPIDGVISRPESTMVYALQRRLNAGAI